MLSFFLWHENIPRVNEELAIPFSKLCATLNPSAICDHIEGNKLRPNKKYVCFGLHAS